jgi:hypothetical protein
MDGQSRPPKLPTLTNSRQASGGALLPNDNLGAPDDYTTERGFDDERRF